MRSVGRLPFWALDAGCIKRSDLKNLQQQLDDIADIIQATFPPQFGNGKGNPDHDPDNDEYPNPENDLDHDEYPNPDQDSDDGAYPHDIQDQYPNQDYSEQKLVPDSPKFQLTG